MQPRWPIQVLIYTGDAVALLVALWLARLVWYEYGSLPHSMPFISLLVENRYMPAALLLGAFWWVALVVEGSYDPLRMISSVRIVQAVFRAFVGVLIGAILVQYFGVYRGYSRLLLMSFLGSTAVLLVLWRLAFFKLQALLPDVIPREGVLVVGVGEDARLMAERLGRYATHVYELCGFLEPARPEEQVVDGPVVGRISDLRRVLDEHRGVGLVIVASRQVGRAEAMQLASQCGHLGLEVLQTPFTWGLAPARVESASVGELELVRLGGIGYPSVAEHVKRAFDLVAVVIGGLLLLPLLLAVALAVKLHDGGPVLYVSERAGRGGRRFRFYKFRSMVPGAAELRDGLPDGTDGRLFKLDVDPRVTRLGAFLRRWSVDELPQLLNVLRGDMNLVGPRPLPIEDLVGIEDDLEHRYWFEQRSGVKPGITGLWQVEGRSDVPFRRMVELDVYYIQHWSLFLDLQILLRTAPAVLRRRGAR